MKRKWIKPIVLSLVFLVSLVWTSIMTNRTNRDLTTSMTGAALPVITFEDRGIQMEELHGYRTRMDVAWMRDSILPVGRDRILELEVNTFGTDTRDVTYQIRSLDGERLVADGELSDVSQKGQKIGGVFQIQNILTREEEYALIVTLNCEGDSVYYYTRIVQAPDYHTEECLDFALQFHEYTFRDDANEFIPTYMDPATGDTTSLQYVDLACTLRQITWADFKGQVLGKPVVSFKEINDSYNVLTLQYVLSSVNDFGQTEYYNIEEYYRLRYTEARMFVLNFERTMNQIFRGENNFISDSTNIVLGIRDSNIEYMESGDIISFVQEGELWCYHINDNTVVQVFSFLGAEGIDARENWKQHDIRIVRMDEAGSVDFIVYGYMNRGDHEGEVGMGIYHYDGLAHTVEEEAFLPTKCSYEILEAKMGQLMYENETDEIYLMIGRTVYKINLATLEIIPEIEDLREGAYAISESNRFFAWVDQGQEYSETVLHLMDLQSGKQTDITEGDSCYVRPLGFLGEDFIYGIAKVSDVAENVAGSTVFPMKSLKIMNLADTGYEVLKEYSQKSRYIGGIAIEDSTIQVHLLKKSEGQMVAAESDSIMNREQEKQTRIVVATMVTDVRETEMILTQQRQLSASKVKMITPRSVLVEDPRLISIETSVDEDDFYVYSKGDVLLATGNIVEAIHRANEVQGLVLDQGQRIIWTRAHADSQSALTDIHPSQSDAGASSLTQCISAILEKNNVDICVSDLVEAGAAPSQILEGQLEDQRILNLTGCMTEELVYYVSMQKPVLAILGDKTGVLITGFGAGSINYYDMNDRKTYSMTYEKADERFAKSGSIFFACVDR